MQRGPRGNPVKERPEMHAVRDKRWGRYAGFGVDGGSGGQRKVGVAEGGPVVKYCLVAPSLFGAHV